MHARSLAAALVAGVCATLVLAGCVSAVDPAEDAGPLPRNGTVDYQLGTISEPAAGTSVVVRDASEPRPDVTFAVCYLNGFQTQPDEAAWWRQEHPELLLRDRDCGYVVDPNWPDELALDPGTPERRAALVAIFAPRIAGCAEAGYDAVEFDNLDAYTRYDGLREADALAFARDLVDIAHEHGLLTGQKNAVELGTRGRTEVGFDFLITEECGSQGLCAEAAASWGDAIIDVEYDDELTRAEFDARCDELPRLAVWRDRMLVGPDEPGYAYAVCAR